MGEGLRSIRVSRSRRKPHWRISSAWDKFKERAFRNRGKREAQKCVFDPDRDFDEAQNQIGKMGSWGTKFGWHVPPKESDPDHWHDDFKKAKRK
jgi:hypothetical protein